MTENGYEQSGAALTLRVFVESGCATCAHAVAMAERAREAYPQLGVEITDVGLSSPQPLPDGVFAVPTVMLGSELVSLGTPDWDALAARIDAALAL